MLCEKDTQTVKKKKKKERMMMMLQKRLVLFESVKKEQEEEEEEEFDYSKLAFGDLFSQKHPCEGVDKLYCNREELYRPLFLYVSSSE